MYGVHVQEHVLQKQLPYSGQTLHIVAEEYDEGPVLAEHKVAVEPGDSPDGLFDRVRELEKYWVPRDIDAFIKARAAYRATNTEA
jgi:phosphoribosylglycinamide formyltransferase-1